MVGVHPYVGRGGVGGTETPVVRPIYVERRYRRRYKFLTDLGLGVLAVAALLCATLGYLWWAWVGVF